MRQVGDEEWCRIYGSLDRVQWIEQQPSVASGQRPCVNAHVRTGGTSRKADACWIVPLTNAEHTEELHQHGIATFEAKYHINLDEKAIETEARWQEYRQTHPPLPW